MRLGCQLYRCPRRGSLPAGIFGRPSVGAGSPRLKIKVIGDEDRLFAARAGQQKRELFLYDATSSYLEGEKNAYGAGGRTPKQALARPYLPRE